MDINMPDIDGITATELVRKKLPYVQVVILSVQSDQSYMRRAMLAGARDFLKQAPLGDDFILPIRRAGDMAHAERAKNAQQNFVAAAAGGAGGASSNFSPAHKGKIIAI